GIASFAGRQQAKRLLLKQSQSIHRARLPSGGELSVQLIEDRSAPAKSVNRDVWQFIHGRQLGIADRRHRIVKIDGRLAVELGLTDREQRIVLTAQESAVRTWP